MDWPGIVIKVPRVYIKTFWNNGRWALKNGYWRGWCRGVSLGNPRWCLADGFFSNWREFWFFITTRHPFVQPTYFSLFGAINIQRKGKECSLNDTDLWCQLMDLADKAVQKDEHHFDHPANFCLEDGRLTMSDYGSPACIEVIRAYGRRIQDSFDSEYDWDEAKKTL